MGFLECLEGGERCKSVCELFLPLSLHTDAARAGVVEAFKQFEQEFQANIRKVEDVLDESLYKRWDALTDPADLHAQVQCSGVFGGFGECARC